MDALITIADREAVLLAPYAMHSVDSRGRHYDEPSHAYRSPYQRDRDRITHCAAFRRLSRKTQVFTGEQGDYHRTRLTHTLEVASIARTMARALRLNEDLVEALALAHDIGHPPFGHAGEEVLDRCLAGQGGFNHNQQAVRIFERLESRYPNFPGLNLTCEVLDGQRYRGDKHNGAPLLEVQVVDLADSIAYDAHDADDALEMGLLTHDDLNRNRLWSEATQRVGDRFGRLDEATLRRAVVHELIDHVVSETLATVSVVLDERAPAAADEARQMGRLIAPPDELRTLQAELEQCLFDRVYRHPVIVGNREKMALALESCFERFVAQPERLPARYAAIAESDGIPRAVGDYLASLTDGGLVDLHAGCVG